MGECEELFTEQWVWKECERSLEAEILSLLDIGGGSCGKFDLGRCQEWGLLQPQLTAAHIWPHSVQKHSLFEHELIPTSISLNPKLYDQSGNITEWVEKIDLGEGKTNDLSMKRPPLPPHLSTRGNPSRLPFLPACFVEEENKLNDHEKTFSHKTFLGERVDFADDGVTVITEEEKAIAASMAETPKEEIANDTFTEEADASLYTFELQTLTDLWNDKTDNSNTQVNTNKVNDKNEEPNNLEDSVIDSLANIAILNISSHRPLVKNNATEWVEILNPNIPIIDFDKMMPNMAYKFPFELDNFQKLAIMKLEEQGHVFVAAHTSAGKTVVAEYAIALSLKHCTRVIYTSPVKALSNQKYREFSRAFGDVGLLTGDIQINTTASCLVMTTEILRSMLYYGSDVIRDLEYVIFDEVHYINDTRRGYVWEEILILLPSHCGIVMLSATVPNTLEFADWVGRTKKRMVYVVSTTKRPVALCHYLYTGMGKGTKNNCFLILGQDGVFLKGGYEKAYQSKIAIQAKTQQYQRGHHLSMGQEKTMWIGLINFLQTNDKLPVVAFVLSRKRCDTIAENLKSQDLTTSSEKSRIHIFIQACLKKLNASDQKLPQVTTLQTLLACGIGVHHSGILPILKEVVEMLFQLGLVKILFATETFAVGVNMPARTVVFDSITKYDGLEWRSLLPSEYIQMAGRAGRRGLDDTGTVIILSKKTVPLSSDLTRMMLGKPTKLSSQFRVTYATMLSLLRVTNLSIEKMMKCSFREFGVQHQTGSHRLEMLNIDKSLSHLNKTTNFEFLSKFSDVALKYHQAMLDTVAALLFQKSKQLSCGRAIVVCFEKYVYQFGIILGYTGERSSEYRVLVLDFNDDYYMRPAKVTNPDLWYILMHYAGHGVLNYSKYTYGKHSIITIKPKHIIKITEVKFPGDCSEILAEYDQRMHSKNNANWRLSKLLAQYLGGLYDLTKNYNTQRHLVRFIDLRKGIKINKGEVLLSLNREDEYCKQINTFGMPAVYLNFYNEFPLVYEIKVLEWKYEELKRLLSSEEMSLYPEYQRRLEVLKDMRYIDTDHHVAIKGRVACELGKNELMITEIVFGNILTDLSPADIAALLSCLVVESRIEVKTPLKFDSILESRINSIRNIDEELTELERKHQVGSDDPTAQADRLNFGLVEVVHEWAQGKPFCEIIKITDVQEGVIVQAIQKVHEVLMNVRDVAKIIGDPILQSKMDEASQAIKRDIVFAASLYTQEDINLKF